MKFKTLLEIFNKSKNNIVINNDKKKINKRFDGSLFDLIKINTSYVTVKGYIYILGNQNNSYSSINEQFNTICEYDLQLIAYDIWGGLFAVKQDVPMENDLVYYFAPDTLEWENMNVNYEGFINWISNGEIDKYYETFVFENIKNYVKQLKINECILVYPYLWANECNIETASKKIVSLIEMININFEYARQLSQQ